MSDTSTIIGLLTEIKDILLDIRNQSFNQNILKKNKEKYDLTILLNSIVTMKGVLYCSILKQRKEESYIKNIGLCSSIDGNNKGELLGLYSSLISCLNYSISKNKPKVLVYFCNRNAADILLRNDIEEDHPFYLLINDINILKETFDITIEYLKDPNLLEIGQESIHLLNEHSKELEKN